MQARATWYVCEERLPQEICLAASCPTTLLTPQASKHATERGSQDRWHADPRLARTLTPTTTNRKRMAKVFMGYNKDHNCQPGDGHKTNICSNHSEFADGVAPLRLNPSKDACICFLLSTFVSPHARDNRLFSTDDAFEGSLTREGKRPSRFTVVMGRRASRTHRDTRRNGPVLGCFLAYLSTSSPSADVIPSLLATLTSSYPSPFEFIRSFEHAPHGGGKQGSGDCRTQIRRKLGK